MEPFPIPVPFPVPVPFNGLEPGTGLFKVKTPHTLSSPREGVGFPFPVMIPSEDQSDEMRLDWIDRNGTGGDGPRFGERKN
jgi:hypothetical protein